VLGKTCGDFGYFHFKIKFQLRDYKDRVSQDVVTAYKKIDFSNSSTIYM